MKKKKGTVKLSDLRKEERQIKAAETTAQQQERFAKESAERVKAFGPGGPSASVQQTLRDLEARAAETREEAEARKEKVAQSLREAQAVANLTRKQYNAVTQRRDRFTGKGKTRRRRQ
jgi:DNA-binding ferritin-like protein